MNTGWNGKHIMTQQNEIINLLGNEYWLELAAPIAAAAADYKPTGK